MDTQIAERNVIIAWLRKEAINKTKLDIAWGDALEYAARCIENGDHLKGEKKEI